ncbi:MAG TPA: hypothetical protein VE754_05295 [Actinomycetota bacterium]|jgi:hypothetical protein|nr:hypothetical protein [Actinomycetota bacterium]
MAKKSEVALGTPAHGKGAASRPPPGRMCAEPGCSTILSTYNASDDCWLHTPPTLRHPLERS